MLEITLKKSVEGKNGTDREGHIVLKRVRSAQEVLMIFLKVDLHDANIEKKLSLEEDKMKEH